MEVGVSEGIRMQILIGLVALVLDVVSVVALALVFPALRGGVPVGLVMGFVGWHVWNLILSIAYFWWEDRERRWSWDRW
jgi:hypothetical protein